MDDQHIDGNGIAAILREIGDAEMTEVLRTCPTCGDRRAIGEHHVHRGAGLVMRCPNCDDIAAVIGLHANSMLVEWRGRHEIPR